MARISDEQIERLKQEVSLERLAEGMGVTLKRHGADLLGLCPFHDDHEPSLVISPNKNLWHCLGACRTGGSVIDWVMKAEGVSFRHAVELLQADFTPLAAGPVAGALPPGAPAYCPSVGIKRSTVRKLPTALATDAEDAQLLGQVIGYYHEALKQSPEALGYLEKRGLANSEIIDHFKLGFANRTLGYRLPEKNRVAGAAIRGQLQRVGLLRGSGHEHFNGSLVIPIFGAGGQVTEVYGRKINDRLRKGTPLHLYLPGPHQGVWNEQALAASKEIILCESLIDALTFWCAGYRNVTASYGTEGFTADHLEAFRRYGIERVLIAYDRDAAGEAAAEALTKRLTVEGLDAYRLHFPKSMDANEYALQVTPAAKSLGVVIRSAAWLGKGKAKPVTTTMVPTTVEIPAEPSPPTEETPPPLAADAQGCASVAEDRESRATKEELPDLLPAQALPEPPSTELSAAISDHEIILTFGERRYRIRGLDKNTHFETLKVNLLVAGPENAVHVDTLDLYQARPRGLYIKQAAIELGVKEDVIKADLGQILLKLEALQEETLQTKQAPKALAVSLSDDERQSALALLQSPDLLEQIRTDFSRCGVVGEDTNKLVGYLAAISRKLDTPLAITIQSTSAAGKSSLMDAVLAFMPEEDRIKYSAMTGQSLFYMGETDLQHKVLAIVEEEGASNAAYALKLLQSEGELTIASTGKDPVTGELKTQDYQVQGPVMIMLTTTAIDIDEELLNRCVVLTIDEGREQTQAIHAIQRNKRTLSGLLAKADKQSILTLHQNAQRLLQALAVMNPYADSLTFVDDRTRTRRDHEKYLTLIDSIALLHQHQRPIKTIEHHGQVLRYVEVTLEDIETANHLAHEALGRTLDELPPQTRKLLGLIVELVTAGCQAQAMKRVDYRFSRRDVRTHTNWSDTALKVHLARLAEMEYLLVHRGGRGQSFVYELLYQGEGGQGESFLMGLIEVEQLRYDEKRSGQKEHRSGSGQPPVRGQSGGGPDEKNPGIANDDKLLDTMEDDIQKNTLIPATTKKSPYRNHTPALQAKGH